MIAIKKILMIFACLLLWIILPKPSLCAGEEGSEIPCTSSSSEAVELFLKGREAYDMGRISDATTFIDKALMKDQQFALAWLYKAYISGSAGDRDLYLGKAQTNRSKASVGERILIDMAGTLPEQGSSERLLLATKLVELYPSSVRALMVLAGEYQLREDYAKFRDLAHIAIHLDPESPLGYRSLASSFLFNPPVDFSLAVKYMGKFVELRSNEAFAHIALGDAYRAQLSLLQARDAYDRAVKLDPACTIALAKRGYMHSYLGMFDNARDDFRKAQDMASENEVPDQPNRSLVCYLFPFTGSFPEEASGLGNLAMAGANGSKYKMEGITPDHHFCCTVVSMSGGLYVAPYQSQKECMCLQREFAQESIVPGTRAMDANFAFMAALRAIQQGDYESASQNIRKYSEYSSPGKNVSRNEACNFLLGLMYLNQGQYNKAISSYLKSDVTNICVKYNLGVAYHLTGDLEQAERMFAEVSQTNSTSYSKSDMIRTANRWMKSMSIAMEQQK